MGWKDNCAFFHFLMSEQDLSMFKGRRQRKDKELEELQERGADGREWVERGPSGQGWE